ncbi:MAG: class I SAM-dependent methyltransferase [Euryarchaeota archaeon]|nr:class I SAM-dependent methyltransferase [Euryarchaeota archaeon]
MPLYEMPAKRNWKYMFWNNEYKNNERVWGERPSELAIVAARYLQKYESTKERLSILDIGCGYGRDVLYFSKHLRCIILGIDNSEKAIDMARNTYHKILNENIKFHCCDFAELSEDRYDVIFIANLYHLLRPAEGERLIKKIKKVLRPGGLLFLNVLSINDLEEYGKGIPVQDESHSFQKDKYLHFFTQEELEEDFNFLSIKELCEHKYAL